MFGLNSRLYTFLTDVILNNPVWENVETVNTNKVETRIGTFWNVLCLLKWLQFHRALTETQKIQRDFCLFLLWWFLTNSDRQEHTV